jgi:hypothetical protein
LSWCSVSDCAVPVSAATEKTIRASLHVALLLLIFMPVIVAFALLGDLFKCDTSVTETAPQNSV